MQKDLFILDIRLNVNKLGTVGKDVETLAKHKAAHTVEKRMLLQKDSGSTDGNADHDSKRAKKAQL